jgi:hypothetical protein
MARPNWYNDNANRAFPFQTGSVGVRVPSSGVVTMRQLPDDFIVDCGFTIGPSATFVEGTDSVYLHQIYRAGSLIYFEFRVSSGEIANYPLIFARTTSDEEYSLEYLDSDNPSEVAGNSVSDSEGSACRMPFWSGYLVTGDISSITGRLADGASIVRSAGDALVETALIENMSDSIVNSFELANGDRTRATSPLGCDPLEWDFTTGLVYEAARCMQGDVKLKAGYNIQIRVQNSSNTIVLASLSGAGEGDPCEEVKLFSGETPPVGATNNVLEGGSLCNEVLRAINGVGGEHFKIIGGQGVSVTPDPGNNCVEIDVNLLTMDLCNYSYVSEAL